MMDSGASTSDVVAVHYSASHESSFYVKVDAAVAVVVFAAVVGELMMTYLLCFVTVGVIAAFELLDD